MKKLLSFIIILFFTISYAQNLKNFTVPRGYKKVTEVKGDLDKDGKDETVIVFDTGKTVSDYESTSGKRIIKESSIS
ncbi:hypothetical protein [Chryseobacterium capnotolerans]|uniref:hypothetical protein n=1 Tax=Chryseobacterium capnotolerans TaxID=2759528 RepID=UPI001E65DE5C|nr:hypothetical protein [Chryseobacterium capnotolerans]